MAKQTTTQKLLTYISKFNGVTSIGLAAQDLKLSVETIRKHFARLCDEGRCCFGWVLMTAKYAHGATKDHRTQMLQQLGEQGGAQVDPYQLGIKWLAVKGAPAVLIPGQAEMARSATISSGGKSRLPLEHMVFEGHMNWEGFTHVLSRMHHHLSTLSTTTASSLAATPPQTAPLAPSPVGAAPTVR